MVVGVFSTVEVLVFMIPMKDLHIVLNYKNKPKKINCKHATTQFSKMYHVSRQ